MEILISLTSLFGIGLIFLWRNGALINPPKISKREQDKIDVLTEKNNEDYQRLENLIDEFRDKHIKYNTNRMSNDHGKVYFHIEYDYSNGDFPIIHTETREIKDHPIMGDILEMGFKNAELKYDYKVDENYKNRTLSFQIKKDRLEYYRNRNKDMEGKFKINLN
jgi:hypothetical protein